ncbi:putative nucleotidyltransferase, ribonuclease H [Tanacetum coccineum]
MRVMNQLLRPFIGKFVVVYFDNILIYSASFSEHVTHVRQVLTLLRKDSFYAATKKCVFMTPKVLFLGRFIPDFSSIMATLTDCMKGKSFVWTEEAESAFQVVKEKLTKALILVLPDFSKVFKLYTDASKVAIRDVLSQGGRRVAYFSEKLTQPDSRYTTYDLEFYAVVQAVKHWRHYLFHKEFVLFTDHDSLRHIRTQDKVSHKHGRWLAFLKFTFVVKHKTGVSNRAADALSRRSNLLVSMQVDVPGLDVIREQLTLDPYFSNVLQGVQSGQKPYFNIHDGFLFKGNQLCIPDTSLRLKIIKELHGEGHVGHDLTLQLVQASYFWPTMRNEVDRYVKRWRICQFLKGTATNACFYMPLSIPVQPWVNISMDFVLVLPRTQKGFVEGCVKFINVVRRQLGRANSKYKQDAYQKSDDRWPPLEIVKKINSNAYRLKLPSHIQCFDVFNVKHLLPYHGDSFDDDLVMNSRANFVYPGGMMQAQIIRSKPRTSCFEAWNEENAMIISFFTFVYAANGGSERRELWLDINRHKAITNGHPWAISGDFNVILYPNEHSAGSSYVTADMMEFKECINQVEVKSGDYNGILKKLDRFIVNEDFMSKYPQAHAIFMPYLISDHIPALLIIPNGMRSKKKSFKFANYITDKEEICPIVNDKWKADMGEMCMYNLVKKLKSLKHPLNNLNWSNGNLIEKVKALKEELKCVQTAIDVDPYDKSLREKRSAILESYLEAVKDEEKLLFQKCKIKWLSYGDKNNSYFHKMLKGRNQRNRIQVIHDPKGQRFEEDQVATQFVNHFQNFLRINMPVSPISDCEELFTTKLSMEEANQMVMPITDKEIRKAMFSIDDNKAPRLDGELNATIVSLTPKINTPLLGGRGLRQGDPMSPYLFTLVMEVFTLIMERNVRNTAEFNYHFRCKNLKITHICFADDLMVFCHGDPCYVKVVKDSIDEFGKCSGLLTNFSKSTVFFGSMNEDEQQILLSILPFRKGNLLMKYLGVPLIYKRLGIKDCKGLIDKGWKNLLAIRDLIRDHVLYNIGNKESTHMWYDNWSGLVPLINFITHRDLYNARLNKDSCVADMISDGAWKNASEWVDNLSFLSKIEVRIIMNGEKDKNAWLDKNGMSHSFTMKNIYDDMREHNKEVKWGKLVCYDMMVCGLCMMNEESHDHLLFQCAYSKAIWLNLQGKMNCTINTQSWKDIVDLIAEKPCLNSIWSIIRRLSFGVVIYFLWQERNLRIFKD